MKKFIATFSDFKLNENYPPGAKYDPSAPWNQKDEEYQRITNLPQDKISYDVVSSDYKEFALLKDKKNGEYYMIFFDPSDSDFKEYLSVPVIDEGPDEDGDPSYDYDYDNAEVDDDAIAMYATEEARMNGIGDGYEDYQDGKIAKVDAEILDDVLDTLERFSKTPPKDFIEKLKELKTHINEGENSEGIHPAIREKLLEYLKENPMATYAEAKKHIGEQISGWKLSEEDFEEAKNS